MSRSGNLLSLLAGAAIGAAAVYLTCTEKGREMVKAGKEAAERCTDDVLEKLEEMKQAVRASSDDEAEAVETEPEPEQERN